MFSSARTVESITLIVLGLSLVIGPMVVGLVNGWRRRESNPRKEQPDRS